MELEHSFAVAAPVEAAWAVLVDLDRVVPCMPGAALSSFDGEAFTGSVRVKVGPVVMAFGGSGRFVERDAGAYRMVIEAAGKDSRGGGTARATIRATLRPDGGATAVAVHTDLTVTGRAAQFGRGMIADVSTRLLGQFTECLAGRLAEPAGADAVPGPAPDVAAAGPAMATEAGPAVTAEAVAEQIAAADAGTGPAAEAAAPAPARPAAEPIDLLGVTGARAAAGRMVGYLVAFVAGALAGGLLVALLVR